MHVVLERAAKRDLEAIALYLEGEAGLEVAERFRFQTETALTQLASMPLIGSLWPSNNPRLQDLRTWPIPGFRKYFVFYISSLERIEILRILHGARDVSAILKGQRGE
ncbi:MAG TPA: type II toxin-antitoxin system RelE/ParE family toxin [Gemmataceae bacterium]|jgi:toxin ParE1/3/4|nr:type II toxin-antitoxin system RelE/ParE family toxin [Gemmataceae bacterium]